MNNVFCFILAALLLAGCASGRKLSPEERAEYERLSTYEAALKKVTCKKDLFGVPGCRYDIGQDLRLVIHNVGSPGANYWVKRSAGKRGDFYATMVPFSLCLVIQRGTPEDPGEQRAAMSDVAFISLGDGGVYRTFDECRQTMENIFY